MAGINWKGAQRAISAGIKQLSNDKTVIVVEPSTRENTENVEEDGPARRGEKEHRVTVVELRSSEKERTESRVSTRARKFITAGAPPVVPKRDWKVLVDGVAHSVVGEVRETKPGDTALAYVFFVER